MDKSIQYVQVMSNFDSVYNAAPNHVQRHPVTYMPTSSSFSSQQSQPMSSFSSSNSKFNFDLYQPNEYLSEPIAYPSPSSSVIIHHQPVYSSPRPSQAISKLRQINDELCYTLAQSDLNNQPRPSPRTHYPVHHHPVSDEIYHSRPSNHRTSSSSSSVESERSEPKKRNARITYKMHVPRRPNSVSKLDDLLISTSDAYVPDDPMTVDVYPTHEQGFVKRIRNRPDNQSPWLADTSPVRRNSYSEASTYRTPRAPNYDHKLLQPKSRLSDCKERPRSSSVKPRFRPNTSPNLLRQSASSFFTTAPVWRPNGSIKRPKFMGSNAPPSIPKAAREPAWKPGGTANNTRHFRAFDPTSKSAPAKINEPIWHPPPKEVKKQGTRYFEPTVKPEMTAPFRQETELVLPRKTIKNPLRMSSGNPELKARIANAESKVKSAWGPTTTTAKAPRPPIPRPVKTTTTTIPSKTKVKPNPSQPVRPVRKVVPAPSTATDTGRSSLNDVPAKPLFQSTPRNQSIVHEDDGSVGDLFDVESQILEPPKKPVIHHPPRQIEMTPPKRHTETVAEPDKQTTSTIKDGVLIHGNDADNIRDMRTPSPAPEINNNDEEEEEVVDEPSVRPSPVLPERKESSPKPNNRDDEETDVLDINDTHDDAEHSFDINKSLDNADKVGTNVSKKEDIISPLPSARPEESENLDENSLQTPASAKKNDQRLPSAPPPPAAAAAATTNTEVDTFFD